MWDGLNDWMNGLLTFFSMFELRFRFLSCFFLGPHQLAMCMDIVGILSFAFVAISRVIFRSTA